MDMPVADNEFPASEILPEEEEKLSEKVEKGRITLVDSRDTEYEYIILDEFEVDGKCYDALVSCDEKVDEGNVKAPGEQNDITVVRKDIVNGETSFSAVTDVDELYKASKVIEERFGHLSDGGMEGM